MNHTRGPWTIGPRREILGQAFDDSARNICDKVRGGSPEAADANARLIAAAPELLDSLKRVLAGFEANVFQRNIDGDGESGWAIKFMPHLMALADATRAIAKAEGQ
jgi:hypothetical protein